MFGVYNKKHRGFDDLLNKMSDNDHIKLDNRPSDPQNDLKLLTVKSILYTLNTNPEAQILLRFAL